MDLKNYSNADGRCVQGGASMLFSKDEKKAGEPKKRSWFGMMFGLGVGDDVRPIGESLRGFVYIIAGIFASAKLFPKDHPALQEGSAVRLSLWYVLMTAWRALVFRRENYFQVGLFFAVIGALGIIFIAAIVLLFSLLSTQAHASNNMFVPSENKDDDWGLSWLNYIFQGKSIAYQTGANNTSGIIAGCGWVKALAVAMAYYSSGIVVLAGVLLLYHLASMIVETAYHGTPMGKQANQIWAPIRLVFAIGLLVPISSTTSSDGSCGGGISGYNAGQYIVIQMARWGSGLASNVWTEFKNQVAKDSSSGTQPLCSSNKYTLDGNVTASSNTTIASPSCFHISPAMRSFLMGAISNIACMKIFNDVAKVTGANQVMFDTSSSKTTFLYNSSDLDGGKICGGYKFVDVTTLPSAYQAVYTDRQTKILNFIKGSLTTAVQNNYEKAIAHTKVGDVATESALSDDFYTIVKNFMDSLDADSKTQLEAIDKKLADENKKIDSSTVVGKGGWLAAGVWFNNIVGQESLRTDAITSVPEIITPKIYSKAYGGSALVEGTAAKAVDYLGYLTNWAGGNLTAKYFTAGSSSTMRDTEKQLELFNIWLYGSQSIKQMTEIQAAQASPSGGGGVTDLPFEAIDTIASTLGLWNKNGVLSINFSSARNPIAEIVAYGQHAIAVGSNMLSLGIMGNAAAAFPVFGSIVGALAGKFSSIAVTVGTMFIGLGVFLAYWLPLFPFVRFFFGSMTWIIGVCEAVVAMPLLALAHLNPTGEGLPGPNAKRGYQLILNVFLRPVLMIFGLVVGYILFSIAISFLNTMFIFAAVGAANITSGSLPSLSRIFYAFIYGALAYALANTAFKSIGFFPQHALAWLGGGSGHHEGMGNQQLISQMAGYVGGTAIMGQVANIGKAPGEAVKGYFDNKEKDAAAKVAGTRHNKLVETLEGLGENNKQIPPGGNSQKEGAIFDQGTTVPGVSGPTGSAGDEKETRDPSGQFPEPETAEVETPKGIPKTKKTSGADQPETSEDATVAENTKQQGRHKPTSPKG